MKIESRNGIVRSSIRGGSIHLSLEDQHIDHIGFEGTRVLHELPLDVGANRCRALINSILRQNEGNLLLYVPAREQRYKTRQSHIGTHAIPASDSVP